jgi:hypothetical protein
MIATAIPGTSNVFMVLSTRLSISLVEIVWAVTEIVARSKKIIGIK